MPAPNEGPTGDTADMGVSSDDSGERLLLPPLNCMLLLVILMVASRSLSVKSLPPKLFMIESPDGALELWKSAGATCPAETRRWRMVVAEPEMPEPLCESLLIALVSRLVVMGECRMDGRERLWWCWW